MSLEWNENWSVCLIRTVNFDEVCIIWQFNKTLTVHCSEVIFVLLIDIIFKVKLIYHKLIFLTYMTHTYSFVRKTTASSWRCPCVNSCVAKAVRVYQRHHIKGVKVQNADLKDVHIEQVWGSSNKIFLCLTRTLLFSLFLFL